MVRQQAQQAMAQLNTTQTAAQRYAQQYQNAAGAFAPGLPVTPLTTMSTISNSTALLLGGETLNESILKKLKGLIK
jgi:hypothetical protein